MMNPIESHTVQFTKQDRPLFDRFQLQLDRAELSRQQQVSPAARPDFGMSVPPVVERRIHSRNGPERERQHTARKKAKESHLGAVAA
jgi:hypothetical protein